MSVSGYLQHMNPPIIHIFPVRGHRLVRSRIVLKILTKVVGRVHSLSIHKQFPYRYCFSVLFINFSVSHLYFLDICRLFVQYPRYLSGSFFLSSESGTLLSRRGKHWMGDWHSMWNWNVSHNLSQAFCRGESTVYMEHMFPVNSLSYILHWSQGRRYIASAFPCCVPVLWVMSKLHSSSNTNHLEFWSLGSGILLSQLRAAWSILITKFFLNKYCLKYWR